MSERCSYRVAMVSDDKEAAVAYVIENDIGGTFTDAFAASESGRVAATKTPSTPPDFSQGFLSVLDELADSLGRPRPACLRAWPGWPGCTR